MQGEIIELHLYDLGGTLDFSTLEKALAPRRPQRAPAVGKGTPAYVEFPQPIVVSQPPLPVDTPIGRFYANITFLYFPVGAVSVRARIPVEVADLTELRTFSRWTVEWKGRKMGLADAARAWVEEERPLWEGSLQDRYTDHVLHESYTVFAFSDVEEPAGAFLERRGPDIAALLRHEEHGLLHEKEVKDALKRWFSYYDDDLIVVDWDAALAIDPSAEYEDLIFVLEIANLQLLEFRSYDDYLDDAIRRGYDELERLFRRSNVLRSARRTAHDLSLLRIDIAELADEAENITKFLGDWFLARVYEAAQEKFHLEPWRRTVDDKLATLYSLYQMAIAESDSRRLLILELLIVLLFVLDLVVLLVLR